MTHNRSTDTDIAVTVKREIPMWGILTLLGAIGSGALSLYVSNQRLVEKVSDQTISLEKLSAKVNVIADESVSRKAAADLLNYRLDNVERRLSTTEATVGAQQQRSNRQ